MQAKDRVYHMMENLCQKQEQMTAMELGELLDLSRQVVSHYLTRLLEQGLVEKTNSRPVYWRVISNNKLDDIDEKEIELNIVDQNKLPANKVVKHKKEDVFSGLIGAYGSQKKVVEQCKAAVNYPPHGISMLITGESGVGKSFLANLIYKYALENKVIAEDAPFIVLNCADYANNPELLSATLLGYKKGSFTGANGDKEGLLKDADGGYLFLDEIHRLSYANQEKLFLFMDTGKFRPLGGSSWNTSSVRFIFATTERPEEVLLETFRRRIAVQININNMIDRPFMERLKMLCIFYHKEAKRIHKNIEIDPQVVAGLCLSKLKGNIGKLQNMIQMSCANAYSVQQDKRVLRIALEEMPYMELVKPEIYDKKIRPILIEFNKEISIIEGEENIFIVKEFLQLFKEISLIPYDEITEAKSEIFLTFKRLCNRVKKEHKLLFTEDNWFMEDSYNRICKKITEQYGVKCPKEALDTMYYIFLLFMDYGDTKLDHPKIQGFFQNILSKTYYIAAKLSEELFRFTAFHCDCLVYICTLLLQEYITEDINLHGLIVAHGKGTASSIQAVANQMCGTFVFESIDMPMEISMEKTIEKVNEYLENVNNSEGVVLLVDTGSLNQMYSSIKNHLSGDLMIINNVTTAIALDVGLKIAAKCSFKEIAESATEKYTIDIQYFEGIAKGNNIIISCMSGVGISEKIKEIMRKVINKDTIDILTMDYRELRTLIEENNEDYFNKTKLVLTTSNLPGTTKIPWINVYDLLDDRGEQFLWNYLKSVISTEHFGMLKREFVKFFSMEGIVSGLQFLNPNVVVNEVESVILKYEEYYNLELTGHIKLNLYMHIAFMIERLMTSDDEEDEMKKEWSLQEREFYKFSVDTFNGIEKKYNIKLNQYELSLLYELFRRVIK